MKKILLSLALAGLMLSAYADERHRLGFDVGFSGANYEHTMQDSMNNISNDSSLGDITGVDIGFSVIINDGLMFGNSNYLNVTHQSLSGTSSLVSDNSILVNHDFNTLKIEMTEIEISKKREYYIGVFGGYSDISNSTSSNVMEYSWMNAGLSAGYIQYFGDFGVGLEGEFYIGLVPKLNASVPGANANLELDSLYSYSVTIPVVYKIGSAFHLYLDNTYRHIDLGATNSINGIDFASSNMNGWKSTLGFRMLLK